MKELEHAGDDSTLDVAHEKQEEKSVSLEGELEIAVEQKADVDSSEQTPCACEGIIELQQSIEGTSLADDKAIVPGCEKDNHDKTV